MVTAMVSHKYLHSLWLFDPDSCCTTGVFIFFGLMMFFGGVFTYLLVPETKNIPLEAMDTLWAGGYSPRKANKQVMDMLRLQSGMNEGGVEAGAAGSDLEKPETEYVEKV